MPGEKIQIKAIIGLGNPGTKYYKTRHSIGFRIIDDLCQKYNSSWKNNDKMEVCQININGNDVLLIKPQTFMNSSGEIIPFLKKKNIESQQILVIHDELELPFGSAKIKFEGSAKGHNGLKSIISFCGPNFYRLRFGIGRPSNREEVPDYVLSNFNSSEETKLEEIINLAIGEIEKLFV